MFEYNSRAGLMTQNGEKIPNGDECYSGTGEGRNNPDMEEVHGVGPTPRGIYRIGPVYDDEGGLGPIVMHLDPLLNTNTFGRTLFRIHGDNVKHDASHGCIIAPRNVRLLIAGARDRVLKVT